MFIPFDLFGPSNYIQMYLIEVVLSGLVYALMFSC